MNNKIALCVLSIFFVLAGSAQAKDEQPLTAEDIVAKMTTELNLTQEQAKDVTPIVAETMRKRRAFLETVEGEFTTDKEMIKFKMRKFQKEENEKLSEILSEEQMQKLREKQRLRNSLNKDEIDYSEGVGSAGFNPSGASVQF